MGLLGGNVEVCEELPCGEAKVWDQSTTGHNSLTKKVPGRGPQAGGFADCSFATKPQTRFVQLRVTLANIQFLVSRWARSPHYSGEKDSPLLSKIAPFVSLSWACVPPVVF